MMSLDAAVKFKRRLKGKLIIYYLTAVCIPLVPSWILVYFFIEKSSKTDLTICHKMLFIAATIIAVTVVMTMFVLQYFLLKHNKFDLYTCYYKKHIIYCVCEKNDVSTCLFFEQQKQKKNNKGCRPSLSKKDMLSMHELFLNYFHSNRHGELNIKNYLSNKEMGIKFKDWFDFIEMPFDFLSGFRSSFFISYFLLCVICVCTIILLFFII